MPVMSPADGEVRTVLRDPTTRALVFVEGESDRAALLAVARRAGRDLRAEGLRLIPIGGATNIRHHTTTLPAQLRLRVRGLCDAGEQGHYDRAFALLPPGVAIDPPAVCRADLEHEMIRALGVERVQEIVLAAGDATRLRLFRQQPAHREEPDGAALHRFLGTTAGRKHRYARLFGEALSPAQVPAPLRAVLNPLD